MRYQRENLARATFLPVMCAVTEGLLSILPVSLLRADVPPAFGWAARGGGKASDFAFDIAVDRSGNAYVTGGIRSTNAHFGAATLTNTGPSAMFVAKYDGEGTLVWLRQSSGDSDTQGNAIALDRAGSAYVAGAFQSQAVFGGTNLTSSGDADAFVVKYDNDGNVVWAASAGGVGADRVFGMTIDTMTNIYIAGYFSETAAFGNTNLTSMSEHDIYVAQLRSAGEFAWAWQAGSLSPYNTGYGIAVDSLGHIFVSGTSGGSGFFGQTNLPNSLEDIFICKLDSDRTLVWARRAGGGSSDAGFGLAIDATGNAYLTGQFSGTASFGTTTFTSYGSQDAFLAKYDSDGNVLWARQAGGSGSDQGREVALDAAGNCYLAGSFTSNAVFGATTITTAGLRDVFVAKYTGAGDLQWVVNPRGNNTKFAYDIALDGQDRIFTCGSFTDTAPFGESSLTSEGADDMFVARLDRPLPALSAQRAGSEILLAWPTDAAGFQLESAPTLASNGWTVVTNMPSIVGDQNVVTNEISGANRFFRLRMPESQFRGAQGLDEE